MGLITKQHPAFHLDGEARKELALQSLNKKQTIVGLAKTNNISRQFVHEQKNKLLSAANKKFTETPEQDRILFYIPIKKSWIEQFTIVLILDCRSTYGGVIKAMNNLLDYNISLGRVSNIVASSIQKAIDMNAKQDLSLVTLGARDEIFHNNKPVLAGIDIPSLYCYLLSEEMHRDSDTWGIHLLDLVKQGFAPERLFGDDADGMALGQILKLAENFMILLSLNLTYYQRYIHIASSPL